MPTASAVMADILDVIRDCRKFIGWSEEHADFLADVKNNVCPYFVRTKADKACVVSAFGNVEMVEKDGYVRFITDEMSDVDLAVKIKTLGVETYRIRIMK